jgi:oligopeptide transport system substrate-binding protein
MRILYRGRLSTAGQSMKQTIPPPLRSARLGFALGACGSGENRVTAGNRDGVLHWGNASEPQGLDPHIATGVPEHKIIMALMEGLVLKDTTTLEPIPGVAKRWEISDDGLV